jgi:predicted nuclease of predicted toxin-antitoxin system
LRGVDVIRCEEVGLARASDVRHLTYATEDERAVVTHDRDFLRLDSAWRAEGKPIFFIQPHLQGNIGAVVKALYTFYQLIEEEAGSIEGDIANQVQYIG